MQFQSKPFRSDPRSKSFGHDAFFGTLGAHLIPDTLQRPRRPVENQLNTLRCAGYAGAVAGGYLHDRRFSPDWQAAKIGDIQKRNVDEQGSDPNAAMKSQCFWYYGGYLPLEDAPLSLEKDGLGRTSGYGSWPAELAKDAENYSDEGYVKIDGPNDTFDNIRSALVKAYDPTTHKGAVVQAFGRWFREWNMGKVIPTAYSDLVGYHSYLFVDFESLNGIPYLIAQNSGGETIGERGFHWFPREVVNREFTGWNSTLKIVKPLTADQIALAKQETPFGQIQRLLIQCWQTLSDTFA